ncbi:BCL-6 corepressor-like protein 1 isoform X2 [Myxocyprinus asiaticus]|uniref:BCL-6 corepressor-like protein 1 isoform X2 n=1 Tax=Myxocyprinus asiaticus TaxID=70543 RepID=UPI002222555A|nr:BCL-6 corepressor-like protein 1 isoform X2 [Myxocyprinus asiaticus]
MQLLSSFSVQVDPSPMNVGDGGTVSRESRAPIQVSESMVGNPQQTLPLELRGDIPQSQQNKLRTTTDCKTLNVCSEASKASNLNHCLQVHPAQIHNNAPVFSNDPVSTLMPDRTEVSKGKVDGAGIYSTHQWPCGKKVSTGDPVNSIHSGISPNKKTSTPAPTQPLISVPLGFQCSTLLKPGQPNTFLPSSNFSSPLCKITLPPGLGQIAALREATASQFQKDCPVQSPCSSTAPMLKTYPYHFSVGRGPGAEKKPPSSASKVRCDSMSNNKGFQGGAEHKATMSSPALALPVQHVTQGSAPPTHYTISPTAAICCSPALANITTQSRLFSLVEKGSTFRGAEKTSLAYLKPKTLSTPEEHNISCPTESRDVPLDLSAKSKRQKSIKDAQNSHPVATEHHSTETHQKNITSSKKVHSASFGSAGTYGHHPDTQRNGATQKSSSKLTNHHALEPAASWAKGSSPGSLNNLSGTYVGVASPILASTLRSKDGKNAAFVEDIQTFAKQETISIIDQGEQPICRDKKAPFFVKGSQHNKGGKLSTGTCSPGAQGFLSTPLAATANSHPHRKSGGGKGGTLFTHPVKSLWQPPCVLSQGASLQKRPSQTQVPKTKDTHSCERALFHISQLSPTKVEDEKWEEAKSPLSNLESIVKQKTLETTALMGENYCNLSAVGSKRPEVVSMQNRCQDSTLQQTFTTGSPSFRAIEGQVIKSNKTSPHTEATATLSRLEVTTMPIPKEKGREKQVKQNENLASDGCQKIKSSTPGKKSTSSVKGEWKERKLAQQLKDETAKEEKASERKHSSHITVEGIAFSLLQSQTVEAAEEQTNMNGAKEEIHSKGKATATKPKKVKKPLKEKTPPDDMQKNTMTKAKKQKDKESPSIQQGSSHKKKKDAVPAVGKSMLKDGTAPALKVGGRTRKGKSSPANMEHSISNKIDSESSPCRSPQDERDSSSLSSPGWPNKKSDSQEEASPRLRRGCRRTDDALLRDLSSAAPPTPPPLDPSSTPPPVPIRRPRGRPRINPLPEEDDADKDRLSEGGDTSSIKKRKRCKNRKYQNGEYITEKDKVADGEEKLAVEDDEKIGVYPCLSATLTSGVPSPDISPRRTLFTRSGLTRSQESPPAPLSNDKPSGKRKFKSKHLCDTEDQKKLKTKRNSLGKRTGNFIPDEDVPVAKKTPTSNASPKQSSSPLSSKKGTAGKIPESTPSRPVPPEVRRLIVNKNAGETLLQRAARLGYQDVVLYCLEKDVREVNRRDNAGYTALHEACARGWTHIIQVLLKHGADVNCSAQDGTRPIHDAVAADNLAAVWMLLNHGADPTLATYSGQTAIKLAQSTGMKTFLKEYFTDLEGRTDQDSLQWDFYSSSVFETEQQPCWDFLLSQPEDEGGEQVKDRDTDTDSFLFEFSSEPLLPCYHVQVSLTQGFCNWFLLTDVLKRLKMSARIFRARYPQFEVASIAQAELWKQVSVSQTCTAPDKLQPGEEDDGEEMMELVRCVPELQGLLGSSIQILREDEDETSGVTDSPSSR